LTKLTTQTRKYEKLITALPSRPVNESILVVSAFLGSMSSSLLVSDQSVVDGVHEGVIFYFNPFGKHISQMDPQKNIFKYGPI
jgi:hypothetical protein